LDFTDGWGTPGNGVDGVVRALREFDDGFGPQLFAAGSFNGSPHPVLKSWDGANWSLVGTSTNSGAAAFALAEWNDGSGDALYVGGSFTDISGVAANFVAKWDGVAWTPLGLGVDNTVRAFAVFDDGGGEQLYVGGFFANAGGASAPRIARWDGSTWSSFGTIPNSVQALAVYDDGSGPALFAAGQSALPLRRWSGSAWTTIPGIGALASTEPWSLVVHDDGSGLGSCLFVGGPFVGPDDRLARWNASGWHAIPGTLTGGVRSLGVWPVGGVDRLFVGGPISFAGVQLGGIGRWDGNGWSAVGDGINYLPGCQTDVYAFAGFDDGAGSRLFIGGDFCSAGQKPASGLARYGDPCAPVVITVQPQSVVAIFDELDPSIDFHVEATGSAPIAYQWRHNGVPIVDDDHIEDSSTPTLHLRSWSVADDGEYDCVVSNGAGSVVSDSATLTVPTSPVGQILEASPLLRSGDIAQGLPAGSQYEDFYPPAVSTDGGLTFLAEVAGPAGAQGRWLAQLDSLGQEFVVRGGDQAPGCPTGVLFDAATLAVQYVPTAARAVAFVASLANFTPPYGNRAVYAKDSMGLSLVALGGELAAGGNPGEVWRDPLVRGASDDGSVWFVAEIRAGTTSAGTGVWRWTRLTGTQLVLRVGGPAPSGGETMVALDTNPMVASASGHVAIRGVVDSYHGALGGAGAYDHVLWTALPGGPLQERVRTGDPAPGFGPQFVIERLNSMQVAESGVLALVVEVVEPGGALTPALYRLTPSGLELIAARGQPTPNDVPVGPTYFSFEPRAITFSGDILFKSGFAAQCNCPTRGLFLATGADVRTVAFDRVDPTPNAPSGLEVVDFGEAGVNEQGHVVAELRLSTTISSTTLWGWSAETALFPISIPGTQAKFDAEEYATIWETFGATGVLIDEADQVTFRVRLFDPTAPVAFLRVPFEYLRNVYRGPGEVICAGDGSGTACPCGNVGGAGRGCLNSQGVGALLEATGTVRVMADDLEFSAEGMPINVSALLFQATGLLQGSGIPFKDGVKCAGGLTRRFGLKSTGAFGATGWGPQLAGQGQWMAGETRYFQAWYRDPSGPCNKQSNTSNALRVTFTP